MNREDLPEHLRALWNPDDLERAPARVGVMGRIGTAAGILTQIDVTLIHAGKNARVVHHFVDEGTRAMVVFVAGDLDGAEDEIRETVRQVAPLTARVEVFGFSRCYREPDEELLAAMEASWRLGGRDAVLELGRELDRENSNGAP